MSFYKNSNTNIREFKRHTFFRIGQYIKFEDHLLIVEDSVTYKLYGGPSCACCFFNRNDFSCTGCCCSKYERCGFDNKDIIYKEVKI